MGPACFSFSFSGQCGGAARIMFGLLNQRWLQRTYHAAGGGCRNRACQVRSWSFEGAGTWAGPFAHTCASVLVGAPVDPPVVGRDWSPVSSNEAGGYCGQTPGGRRAPLQPGRAARRYLRARRRYLRFARTSVQREPLFGGPGPGFRPGRRCFPCQLPLWFYESDTIPQPGA
jgi:hypothetical protein